MVRSRLLRPGDQTISPALLLRPEDEFEDLRRQGAVPHQDFEPLARIVVLEHLVEVGAAECNDEPLAQQCALRATEFIQVERLVRALSQIGHQR